MTATDALHEVLTLSEAADLSARLGYAVGRSSLSRYAKTGRLTARKSKGTWLTSRTALARLIAELRVERRDHPRPAEGPPEALPSEVRDMLDEIDRLLAELARRPSPSKAVIEALETDAIYYTAHIEGNPLSLREARAVIDAYRVERNKVAKEPFPESLPG